MADYRAVLDKIYNELKMSEQRGVVADYIPALSKVSADHLGIFIRTIDGEEFGVGDFQKTFSIQSISKLFVLTMAMIHTDSDRWDRVGREPSGSAFNSLVQLEQESGRPRNPFINAGAIVMTDYLYDFYPTPQNSIVSFIQKLAGNSEIAVNPEVFESEKATGHRNYALGHFMKSFNNIHHDVRQVLETYFFHCSLQMSCEDLARSAHFLMNNGLDMQGNQVLDKGRVRRINSLMLTCGPYDDAGEFAFKIGLPTKSGVGGGIVAVCPGKFTATVWSPGLNRAGNSYLGTKALELLANELDVSIF